jgi:hypothetical protein
MDHVRVEDALDFHASRRKELHGILDGSPDAPIFAAWGMARGLRPYASEAKSALQQRHVIGLPGRHDWQFRHPLPRRDSMRRAWLHDMVGYIHGQLGRSCQRIG